ncbi:ArsR/SmtB family transcription factor [Xanthovirga aplysinae]|uniref:ArsR/SmtB family transcription factor n=1 Tax=Xanthovirga aplysinae TaxID=2529853 RepID=UPI0012BC679B|nr:metalloregulator ArsR/SmtB family transcription factor [Xanthovirga aplysinae]MTI32945.1 ArsR family transcriptional regulator [Xanthovirga aplysinae]
MTVVKDKLEADKLLKVAEILKTIAHPVRLKIIEVLSDEKRTVSELMEATAIEQSLISHHLIKMKDKGVLSSYREGKNVYYQLVDDHITKIFDCMEGCSFI